MRRQSTLPGLTEEMAARRLLDRLNGHRTTTIAEDEPQEHSGDPLLARLEQHGVRGRLARIGHEELPGVQTPTLARLKNGRWLVITKAGFRGLTAEDALGRPHALSYRELRPAFDGLVLDRSLDLPRGTTVCQRTLALIWQQRKTLGAILMLTVLLLAFSIVSPQLTGILLDEAVPQRSYSLLWGVVGGMVLIAFFRTWAGWFEQHILQRMLVRLDAMIDRALLAHVLHLPYRYLEGRSVGAIMQGFNGFTQARTALTSDALGVLVGGVGGIALLVAMYGSMPAPAAVVAAAGAVCVLIAIRSGSRQQKVQQQLVDATVSERDSALEIFTRMTTLKAAGAADRAVDRWLGLLRRSRALNFQSERLALGSQTAVDLIGQMQLQMLWLWGGLRVMQGSLRLGELVAFTLMAGFFHASTGRFARSFVKLRALRPQLVQAESLVAQTPIAPARSAAGRRPRCAVEIRGLRFRYDENRPWVIDGLDLTVRPGETHRLAGPSGFGKTTLLKLVAGLYEPAEGQILVGGRAPQDARGNLIFLPQHVQVFNASVLDNLRLFSAGAPLERLMHAGDLTGLTEWVETLPMGYDTLLAHSGANFSGGQRQLIVLTAALASDRPVLLLDEATASIDSARTRRLAQCSLFAEKTVLYASHTTRLST